MIRKALVADDDEMVLCLLEYVLELRGYDITKATDGDRALKELETEEFDLVITDLQMGRTSGFNVIRKAKDTNSETIVFMITGCCDPSKETEAFQQGVDGFLFKPFRLDDLLEQIQVQESKRFCPPVSIVQRDSRRGQSVRKFCKV